MVRSPLGRAGGDAGGLLCGTIFLTDKLRMVPVSFRTSSFQPRGALAVAMRDLLIENWIWRANQWGNRVRKGAECAT